MSLRRFSFLDAETFENEGAPDRFRARWASVHRAIGAEHLQGNLIVIAPGATSAPYHWEASQEEWLLVLSGTPTVRTPEGEQQLRPGDLTCFAVGPEGAHQVTNATDTEVRVILLSDFRRPEVIVYPDSGKVMITDPGLETLLSLEATVHYWQGESS